MTDLNFVPALDVAEVSGDVHDIAKLLGDRQRMDSASAFLVLRDEDWGRLYYVFGHEDIEELLRALQEQHRGIEDLTRDELFNYLDIHEHTRAQVVQRDVEPGTRAVVLDAAGAVEGVWADSESPAPPPRPAVAEPPANKAIEPSMAERAAPVPRNGGGLRRRGLPGSRGRRREVPPEGATRHTGTRGTRAQRKEVDRVWRRTPHVDLSSDDEPLAAGKEFEALVHLNTQAPSANETTSGVEVELPPDVTRLDFEVEIGASAHFRIKGETSKMLSVDVEENQSVKLSFDLEVVANPAVETPAWVAAFFTCRNRQCGSVRRGVALQGGPLPAAAEPSEAPPDLVVDPWAKAADLNVRIRESKEADDRHFLVKLSTPHLDDPALKEETEWTLDVDTETYVARRMEQFTLDGATAFARQLSLRGAGNEFWDDAPEAFKGLLWKLLEHDPPLRTISIVSEEPSIPWELMCPENEDGSRRDPLGVEFVVGRFVDRRLRAPQQQAPVDKSFVIAPKYRPALPKSASEATWVCDHFHGTRIDPATHEGMEEFFGRGGVGLVHFVAHGEAQPGQDQALRLDRGAMFFANQVSALTNLGKAFRSNTPLVFLNACEVGRSSPTLVGVGGFAQAFIASGARGVVAPIWSVDDTIAHEIALEFYERAIADRARPFADILREIRAKAYAQNGEDTYAAYCWYGDPETALGPPST